MRYIQAKLLNLLQQIFNTTYELLQAYAREGKIANFLDYSIFRGFQSGGECEYESKKWLSKKSSQVF
jgi:hypothetical protein